jgi:poly(beta-D-mannuronate) lyase
MSVATFGPAYASPDKTGGAQAPGVYGNPVESILDKGRYLPDPQEKSDPVPDPLRRVQVSTIADLMGAIKKAQPGDHIILKDGTYDTEDWLDEHSADSLLVEGVKGTKSAPIVIAAGTVGGAVIEGPAGFSFIGASHLVVKGFTFTHEQAGDEIAIECEGCQHVRFTQNRFDLGESDDDGSSHWLGITSKHGAYNRIDHNTFENKKTQGNYVLLLGSDGEMPEHNRIDHNYFYNHAYSGGNGGECLRVGNSVYGTSASNTVVAYNLFEKCNGDAEVVSVKSSENVLRHNAFTGNEGSLVLRHGSANLIDGNLFVGNEGGVRVYGNYQKIVNNYFEDNSGDKGRRTLVVGSGTVETDKKSSNDEYSRAKNIAISNNTFAGNESNIIMGYGDGDLAPKNIQIGKNTVRDGSALVEYEDK